MIPSHTVTQFNSGQPLRSRRPTDLVHPFLHEVKFTLHAHEICGIIDATNGANTGTHTYNQKPLLVSIELIESDSRGGSNG